MSLYEGKTIQVQIEGESHAPQMTVRVHGMPAMAIDMDALNAFLARRKAVAAAYSTARVESDLPYFEGLDGNKIVGDFAAHIQNNNVRKGDYNALYGIPRPSHADYAWYQKDGTLDFAGGGRFSGRLTAPLCVAGGIALQYLALQGIAVRGYIAQLGDAKGLSYKDADFCLEKLDAMQTQLPTLRNQEDMLAAIENAKQNADSVGGRIECIVTGLPAGLGDNLFEGLEGKISSLVYAVPAVKGVEFGLGFDFCHANGSVANDQLYYDQDGRVAFASNHSGGINGGISNGNYLSLGVAVKPTPSIAKEQTSVDLVRHSTVQIRIAGRHDTCIVPRAIPAIESAVALALADVLLSNETDRKSW